MSMSNKTGRVAVLVGVLLFAAFYSYVNASFRHQAFPITQQRIDQATNPADRAFLIEQKEKKAREIQQEKDAGERNALIALGLAGCAGIWYVRVRRAERLARNQ